VARESRESHETAARVLAIGLDGLEVTETERMMHAGELPALAALRDRSARFLLDHGPAQRTGLAWEHFWSGLTPEAAGRASAVEFDPSTYAVRQDGARFPPFFSNLDIDTVVVDPPYADLRLSPSVKGVAAWGAHDPGINATATSPTSLIGELEARFGSYPADRWMYATPWSSPVATTAMGDALAAGIRTRAELAQWLLTERFPDWDLGVVVVAEPHSAAEGLWHGIDPAHPLHEHESARAAADGFAAVYRAADQLVADLIAGTGAPTVVVFSPGGMGANHSDAASMLLLPELLFRWSSGTRALDVPARWHATPDLVPVPNGDADARWKREWFQRLDSGGSSSGASGVLRRIARPALPALRKMRARLPWLAPSGDGSLAWQPATWYRHHWPSMRAFALPSFYDGRIRVNLRGRERDGIVEPSDYTALCDELEGLARACVDPRTGRSVVETVERAASDPLHLDSSASDLVVVWRGCALAFDHPEHGLVGPVPYRRTGGHTGPFGFAYVSGPGIEPVDGGIASSFDVAPTIAELLGGTCHGISGSPLRLAARV
jgi:predicted AlkP superfamily phosphohydrolase/phosphomutase